MRYDNPALRDLLAGEYALGTLRGRARDRFQRLLATDKNLHVLVHAWQERFAPLAEETRAVTPPARVFLAIKARLEAVPVPAAPAWWQRLGFWHAVSASVAVIALTLAVLLGNVILRPAAPPAGPNYVALLQDDAARPALMLTAYNKPSWHLNAEMLAERGVPPGQAMQVWAIARDTGDTRLLITLTAERAQRIALSEAAWKLVKGAEFLIVTLEPAGSAAREPSGPTLYRGYCINLKGLGVS
jgi:anti-sigma-K factor RskA